MLQYARLTAVIDPCIGSINELVVRTKESKLPRCVPVLEEASKFNPTWEHLVLGAEKIEIAHSRVIVHVELERSAVACRISDIGVHAVVDAGRSIGLLLERCFVRHSDSAGWTVGLVTWFQIKNLAKLVEIEVAVCVMRLQ